MSHVYWLHFCDSNRAHALGKHKAFVQGVENYVTPAFQNIEQDAETFSEQEYDRLHSSPGWDGGPDGTDIYDIAEQAHDEGIARYEDLMFAKGQVMVLATAGLYHLWEKTIKSFIIREFQNCPNRCLGKIYRGEPIEDVEAIQSANFPAICRWLGQWSFSECKDKKEIRNNLQILNLIANTAKHGGGQSCKQLFEKHPEFFKGLYQEYLSDEIHEDIKDNRRDPEVAEVDGDPDNLWVTPEMFRDLASHVEQFWNAMPERLNIKCRNQQ
jgi:hypothetical protein